MRITLSCDAYQLTIARNSHCERILCSLYAGAHRFAARRNLSAPVDLHPDFLFRRAGDPACVAVDGGRAVACGADADGRTDGDRNRAVRIVFPADRGLARSRAQTARVYSCLLYTSDAADDLLCVD